MVCSNHVQAAPQMPVRCSVDVAMWRLEIVTRCLVEREHGRETSAAVFENMHELFGLAPRPPRARCLSVSRSWSAGLAIIVPLVLPKFSEYSVSSSMPLTVAMAFIHLSVWEE